MGFDVILAMLVAVSIVLALYNILIKMEKADEAEQRNKK